jgi:hypothetical protein
MVYFDHEYGFAHHWFLKLLAIAGLTEEITLVYQVEAQSGH